MQGCKHCMRKG